MHDRNAAIHATKYRADIDGLRSLAVLPVVLYHAGISFISGGYVGVDVFFVISGYLITGILISDFELGRFSIAEFYERRIRRILPALTFVCLATTAVVWVVYLPSYLEDFSRSLAATAAFLSNMYFWRYSGYFDNGAQLRPLLHTWSLAVEEQFYIVMPIAIYVVYRFLKRWAVPLFATAALLSLALSILLATTAPTANFFILPTRTWELLAGSLLAIARPAPLRQALLNNLLALCGAVLILVPVFLYTDSTSFPGLTALPPVLGAALIIYAGGGSATLTGQILSSPPLVFIGKISYSLYLVHWPVVVIYRYLSLRPPDAMSITIILVLSFALAVLSWRFIEQPFRNRSFLPSRLVVFGLAILALLAIGGAGAIGIVTKGMPQRFPGYIEARTDGGASGGSTWNNDTCFFQGDMTPSRWHAENCAITPAGREPLLLWGDSFAAHYVPGLVAKADAFDYTIYQYTAAGCPPALTYTAYARPQCQAFNANALDVIDSLGIRKVVLSARWTDLRSRGLGSLRSTLDALAARGVETYVIGQSPIFITDVDVIAFLKSDGTKAVDRWPVSIDASLNRELREITGDHHFIDPIALTCDAEGCPYRADGAFLYFDFGHFTQAGSEAAVASYFPYRRTAD